MIRVCRSLSVVYTLVGIQLVTIPALAQAINPARSAVSHAVGFVREPSKEVPGGSDSRAVPGRLTLSGSKGFEWAGTTTKGAGRTFGDPMDMVNMPSVGPLFVETETFSTTLNIVNAGNASVTGTLIVRSFDGSALAVRPVPVAGHSDVGIRIADLLASVGSSARQGRVELYDDTTNGSALAGQLTIGYEDQGGTHILDEELLMPTLLQSHTLRAVTVGATDEPFVAIANPGALAEDISISCYPEGLPSEMLHISIAPLQTSLLHGCKEITSSPAAYWSNPKGGSSHKGAYALELVALTPHSEIEAFGLSPRVKNGTIDWTSMNFSDPAKTAASKTVFAGIPFGNTPLLWGSYSPKITMHNFSGKPKNVKVVLDADMSGFAVRTIVASLTLPPNESATVDRLQGAGNSDLQNTITVDEGDDSGDVVSALVIDNQSKDILMQLVGKSGADDTNIGMHPWAISDSEDSSLLLYNETEAPHSVHLKIANGRSIWEKTIVVPPLDTQKLTVKTLLEQHAKDDHGIELSAGNRHGEISWAVEKGGYIKGRLLRIDNASHTVEGFQCAGYQVLCDASITGPSAMNEGQTGSWTALAQGCINNEAPQLCNGVLGGSASIAGYSWQLGGFNISFGSTQTVTAEATGGPASLNVNVTDSWGCTVSASQSVTVTGYPAAHVSSVSPPVWPAGSTALPVTITGTNFGSNPTVLLAASGVSPTAVTVASSNNGTTLTIPVNIAANTPNEPVAITVIPGYPGTTFSCNCSGTGYGVSGAIVTAISGPPVIVLTDGTTSSPFAGQGVSVTLTPPAGLKIMSQTWALSSTLDAVLTYQADPINGGVVYPIAPAALTQPTLRVYYIVPGVNETLSVSVTYDNGNTGTASTQFSVQGPTNPSITATTGSVVIRSAANDPTNHFDSIALDGVIIPNRGTAGIQFVGTSTLPTANPGAYQWVQIVTHDTTTLLVSSRGIAVCPAFTDQQVLDNTYPYGDEGGNLFTTTVKDDTVTDNPYSQLYSTNGELARTFAATMYLMWTPEGADVIPIPLAQLSWGVYENGIDTLATQANGTTWTVIPCSTSTKGTCAVSHPRTDSMQSYPTWQNTEGVSPAPPCTTTPFAGGE